MARLRTGRTNFVIAHRLSALAVVPPWGTPESMREVERCINELGFVGVQMAAHYGQLYLDDEAFKPYLRFLNKLEVPAIVHHTPLDAVLH